MDIVKKNKTKTKNTNIVRDEIKIHYHHLTKMVKAKCSKCLEDINTKNRGHKLVYNYSDKNQMTIICLKLCTLQRLKANSCI